MPYSIFAPKLPCILRRLNLVLNDKVLSYKTQANTEGSEDHVGQFSGDYRTYQLPVVGRRAPTWCASVQAVEEAKVGAARSSSNSASV